MKKIILLFLVLLVWTACVPWRPMTGIDKYTDTVYKFVVDSWDPEKRIVTLTCNQMAVNNERKLELVSENVVFLKSDAYGGQSDFASVLIFCHFDRSESYFVPAERVSDSEVRLVIPEEFGEREIFISVNPSYLLPLEYPDASYHATDWFEL